MSIALWSCLFVAVIIHGGLYIVIIQSVDKSNSDSVLLTAHDIRPNVIEVLDGGSSIIVAITSVHTEPNLSHICSCINRFCCLATHQHC